MGLFDTLHFTTSLLTLYSTHCMALWLSWSGPLLHASSQDIKAVADELGIAPTVISGEDLNKGGFGGIYGVGKAAAHPPILAILSHTPPGAAKTIAWVGKGIVYDTGGLSLKDKVRSSCWRAACSAVT